MHKPVVASNAVEISSLIKSAQGESLPFRQIFDAVAKAIPCAQVLMVSSLPRGGLQIVQPSNCPEILIKGYNRELHTEDRLTWQAIQKGSPVKGSTAWPSGSYEGSRYVQELLEPAGLACCRRRHAEGPGARGYPGALHLYRKLGDAPFSDQELEQLADIGRQLDDGIDEVRQARHSADDETTAWGHFGAVRQLAFDRNGKQQLATAGQPLDQRLIQQMVQHTQHRLTNLNGDEQCRPTACSCPTRAATSGFSGPSRSTAIRRWATGRSMFFCLQPESWEWDAVRVADVQADPEMSRLIPAVKFMHAGVRPQPDPRRDRRQGAPQPVPLPPAVHGPGRSDAQALPARVPDPPGEGTAGRAEEGTVGDRQGVRVRPPEPLHQPVQAGDGPDPDALAAAGGGPGEAPR